MADPTTESTLDAYSEIAINSANAHKGVYLSTELV